jgi:hypothetical protein
MILLLAALPATLLMVWGYWRWERDGCPHLLAVMRGKGRRAGYFAMVAGFLLLAFALSPLGVSAVEISN